MISTRIVTRIEEVNSAWIFEYYLNLDAKLTGQEVKIKSIFNLKDTNPSMGIYINRKYGSYFFNDFSTGLSGTGSILVAKLFNISSGVAVGKIINDYNEFIYKNPGGYSTSQFKEIAKYSISDHTRRSWNTEDARYWMSYGIGSETLEKYNVCALANYSMTKEDNTFIVNAPYLYGYFRQDGTLYKIYQPKNKEKKFLKIRCYIQGTDQLTFQSKYLVVCSSLKDLMCIEEMNINLELVAPDSETTMIGPDIIESYKHKYQNICVLFDNDTAGLAGMAKYRDAYNMASVHLDLEKDVSDSVKKLGRDKVKEVLFPLLKETLNPKKECLEQ